MTMQTSAPVEPLIVEPFARTAAHYMYDLFDLSPSYQRGSVWSTAQRQALILSFLRGVPVPAVVLSNRLHGAWPKANPEYAETGKPYAVIDGKQRIEAVRAWFADEFAVPATWFHAEDVKATTETDDGPYVTSSQLSRAAQTMASMRWQLPSIETSSCASEAEEAALYVLLNGGGIAQTDADMTNAARVASGA